MVNYTDMATLLCVLTDCFFFFAEVAIGNKELKTLINSLHLQAAKA